MRIVECDVKEICIEDIWELPDHRYPDRGIQTEVKHLISCIRPTNCGAFSVIVGMGAVFHKGAS